MQMNKRQLQEKVDRLLKAAREVRDILDKALGIEPEVEKKP